MLAEPGDVAPVERGEQRDERVARVAGSVGVGEADVRDVAVGVADEAVERGARLEVGAESLVEAVRAGLAERGHAHGDDARVDLREALWREAPVRQHVRPEVVDDDVAALDEPHDGVAGLFEAHVERERALADVEVVEADDGVRAHVAAVEGCVLLETLDLDDLRAVGGEPLRVQRPRDNPSEVADAESREGACGSLRRIPPSRHCAATSPLKGEVLGLAQRRRGRSLAEAAGETVGRSGVGEGCAVVGDACGRSLHPRVGGRW